MSVIDRQQVIWNGQVLEIPFAAGHATAEGLLALVRSGDSPELGLFTEDGLQLDPGAALPGGDEVLVLRPVYLH